MITQDKITYSAFGIDPIGRVFFYKDRVFRGIYGGARTEIEEFLASDLFNLLIHRHFIPNTWVAHDVKLTEFPLVLEHERCYISPYTDWTFEMSRDAAIFTLELEELCEKYGYYLKDEHQGNISFLDGHPIMIDFGSFIKGSRPKEWGRQFIERQYLVLQMYAQGDTQLAQYCRIMSLGLPLMLPEKSAYHVESMRRYYHGLVKYYEVYAKRKWKLSQIHLHTLWAVSIIDRINKLAQKLLHKDYDWNFLKISPKYRSISVALIKRIKSPFECTCPIFPVEGELPSKQFFNTSAKYKGKRILLVGNWKPSIVISLYKETQPKELLVMSNDYVYLDMLYREIRKAELNIFPIAWCLPHIPLRYDKHMSHLMSDLVIIGEIQNEWLYPKGRYQTNILSFPASLIAQALAKYCNKELLIKSVSDNVEKALRKYFKTPMSENFEAVSGWMLLRI